MFLLLQGFALCYQSSTFICFGTRDACADYIADANMSLFKFKIVDIADANKYASSYKKNSYIFITENTSDPIEIDMRNLKGLNLDINIYGNDNLPKINLYTENNKNGSILFLYKVILTNFAEDLDYDLEFLEIYLNETVIVSDYKTYCNYLTIDAVSDISNIQIRTRRLKVDYGRESMIPRYKDKYYYINCSYKYLIADTDSCILKKEIDDEHPLEIKARSGYISLDISNYNLTSKKSILAISVKNSSISNSEYNDYSINLYSTTITLKFCGDFYEDDDISIFRMYNYYDNRYSIIFNTSYAPFEIGLHSSHFVLQNDEVVFKYDFFTNRPIILSSHEDFINRKINVHIKGEEFKMYPESSNLNLIYEHSKVPYGLNVVVKDNGASTITANSFVVKYYFHINIFVEPSPNVSDEAMSIFNDAHKIVQIKNVEQEWFEGVDVRINTPEKFEFMKSILKFEKSLDSDKTFTLTIKKIGEIPKFTPDIYICDRLCDCTQISIWFNRDNISSLFNYLDTSNTTIIFEDFVWHSDILNLTELPNQEQSNLTIKSSRDLFEIGVCGDLHVYSLALNNIILSAKHHTNYQIAYLSVFDESTIFGDSISYNKEMIAQVSMENVEKFPKDLSLYRIIIKGDGGAYALFTESTLYLSRSWYENKPKYNITDYHVNLIVGDITFVNIDNKPITDYKGNSISVLRCGRLRFIDCTGCFLDFIDLSKEYDFRVYASDNFIPMFNGINGFDVNSHKFKEVCIYPNDYTGEKYCRTGQDAGYTYDDALKVINETSYEETLTISIYPMDEIIDLSNCELTSYELVIKRMDNRSELKRPIVKLPRILPKYNSCKFEGIQILIDTSETYVLEGTYIETDLIIKNYSANCFYYVDTYDIDLVDSLNIKKKSNEFKNFNGKLSDITENIYVRSPEYDIITIKDASDIIVKFNDSKFEIRAISNLDYCVFLDGIKFKFEFINDVRVETFSDKLFNKKIEFSGNAHYYKLDQLFNSIVIHSTYANIYLKSREDNLNQFYSLLVKSHVANLYFSSSVNFTSLGINQFGYYGSYNNRINFISLVDDKQIVISCDYFSTSRYLYNFIFSPQIKFEIKNMTEIEYYESFLKYSQYKLNYNFINQFHFKYPPLTNISIIDIDIDVENGPYQNYSDFEILNNPFTIVSFENATISGFNDKIDNNNPFNQELFDIMSIKHTINEIILFMRDNHTIDFCYDDSQGNCPEKYAKLDQITMNEIEKYLDSEAVTINIHIKCPNTLIELELNRTININFIGTSYETTNIIINKSMNIRTLGFIDISANISSISMKVKQIKIKRSLIIGQKGFKYEEIYSDIESLQKSEFNNNKAKLYIDPEDRLTDIYLTASYMKINEKLMEKYYPDVTIDQRSISNETTWVFIYQSVKYLSLVLYSDFEVKFNGYSPGIDVSIIGDHKLTMKIAETIIVSHSIYQRFECYKIPQSVAQYCIGTSSELCQNGYTLIEENQLDELIINNRFDSFSVQITKDTQVNLSDLAKENIIAFFSNSEEKNTLDIFSNWYLKFTGIKAINLKVNIQNTKPTYRSTSFKVLSILDTIVLNSEEIKVSDTLEFDLYSLNKSSIYLSYKSDRVVSFMKNLSIIPNISITLSQFDLKFIVSDISILNITHQSDKHIYVDGVHIVDLDTRENFTIINKNTEKTLKIIISGKQYNDYNFSLSTSNCIFVLEGDVDFVNFTGKIPNQIVLHDKNYRNVYWATTKLENDVEISCIEKDTRVEIRFNSPIDFNGYKFSLKSCNIDAIFEKLDCKSLYLPIYMAFDSTDIATVYYKDIPLLYYNWVVTLIPLFDSQPSDSDIESLKNRNILKIQYSRQTLYRIYPQIVKVNYFYDGDTRYYGMLNDQSVIKTNSQIIKEGEGNYLFNVNIELDKIVDLTTMKLCIGTLENCPENSLPVNSDIKLSTYVTPVMTDLVIFVVEANKKITFDKTNSNFNMTIKGLASDPVNVEFMTPIFNFNALTLEGLAITCTEEWKLAIKSLTISGTVLPGSVAYSFTKEFYANLDYEAYEVIGMKESMKSLKIIQCKADSITFTITGCKLDNNDLIIGSKLSEIHMAKKSGLNLKIEAEKYIGLTIIGEIDTVKCYGIEWMNTFPLKSIIVDHGDRSIKFVSDVYFNPIVFIGSGLVTEQLADYPVQTSICFYDSTNSKGRCTANNQYDISLFTAQINSLTDFNYKIEIVSTTEQSLSVQFGFFRFRFLEFISIDKVVTISTNIDNTKDTYIYKMNLNNMKINFNQKYEKEFSIINANFVCSEVLNQGFTNRIRIFSFDTDENSILNNCEIVDDMIINYDDKKYIEKKVFVNDAILKINGFNDLFNIKNVDNKSIIINDALQIDLTDATNATLSIKDSTIDIKKISIEFQENVTSLSVQLDIDGKYELVTDCADSNILINISGELNVCGRLHSMSLSSQVLINMTDHFYVTKCYINHNTTVTGEFNFTAQELIFKENLFVNLKRNQLIVDIIRIKNNSITFPFIFEFTDKYISYLEIGKIFAEFSKEWKYVIVKSMLQEPVVITETQKMKFIKKNYPYYEIAHMRLTLLVEKPFFGFWDKVSAVDTQFGYLSDNGIIKMLVIKSFKAVETKLCYDYNCSDGVFLSKDDDINLYVSHLQEKIHFSIYNDANFVLPPAHYNHIFIEGKNASFCKFSLNVINTCDVLEIKRIEQEIFQCSTSKDFRLIINNCKISKIEGALDNHSLVISLENYLALEVNSIKNITFSDSLYFTSIIFNKRSIQIDDLILPTEANGIYWFDYYRNNENVTMQFDSTVEKFDYSINIYVSTISLLLVGEWHEMMIYNSHIINRQYGYAYIYANESYSEPFIFEGIFYQIERYEFLKIAPQVTMCICDSNCTALCRYKDYVFNSFDSISHNLRKFSGEVTKIDISIKDTNSTNILQLDLLNFYKFNQKITISSLDDIQYIEIININYLFDLTLNDIEFSSEVPFNFSSLTIGKSSKFNVPDLHAHYFYSRSYLFGINNISVEILKSLPAFFDLVQVDGRNASFINSTTGEGLYFRDLKYINLDFNEIIENITLVDNKDLSSEVYKNFDFDKSFETINYDMDAGLSISNGFYQEQSIDPTINLYRDITSSIYYYFSQDTLLIELKLMKDNLLIRSLENTYKVGSGIGNIENVTFKYTKRSCIVLLSSQIKKASFYEVYSFKKEFMPFGFQLDDKVSYVDFQYNHSGMSNSIYFYVADYEKARNLINKKIKIADFMNPLEGAFNMKWKDDFYHGFNSKINCFSLLSENHSIYLVGEKDFKDVPAKVCANNNVYECPADYSYNFIWKKMDFSMFPRDIKSITILIPKIYDMGIDNFVFDGGETFELYSISTPGELKLSETLSVKNFKSVSIKNLKISSEFDIKLEQTSVTLEKSRIVNDAKVSFAGSNVVMDIESAKSVFTYIGEDAKSLVVKFIDRDLIIVHDANGKYPYIDGLVKSKTYKFIGPTGASKINFMYGKYEKSAGEIVFELNGPVSILVFDFVEGSSFQTNLKFITNGNKVKLYGVKSIPANLFSNVKDVTIAGETVPPPDPTRSRSPAPTMTPTPEPTPITIIVEGKEDPEGVRVEKFEPIKGSTILVTENKEEKLIIENLTIAPGSKVAAVNLVIEQTLSISGDSSLRPSEGSKIEIKKDNTVDIKLEAEDAKLPKLDLGNVGADYQIAPKELEIKMNLADVDEKEIENEFGNGKVVVSGRTLNCEQWIEKTSISNIVGSEDFVFELICEDSRLLELPLRSMVLKAKSNATSKPKDNLAAIIGGVIGAVVVIAVIIVVVLFVMKKKEKRESSGSTSISLDNDSELNEENDKNHLSSDNNEEEEEANESIKSSSESDSDNENIKTDLL